MKENWRYNELFIKTFFLIMITWGLYIFVFNLSNLPEMECSKLNDTCNIYSINVINKTKKLVDKFNISDNDIEILKKEVANTLKDTDYSEEAIEKLRSVMTEKGYTDEIFDKFKAKSAKSASDILKTSKPDYNMEATLIEGMQHPKIYASTYFNNPDKTIKQQRIAAVAGTYIGVNAGARLLSGGNLTHDEYGQKNIAGIPFI